MEFRKSIKSDLEYIMKIIKGAQDYLKDRGIDQWQNNYPNEEVILNDISNNNSYVLVKNNEVVGTAVISFDGEETYEKIYQGKWLSDKKFAVIHRIAVDSEVKGNGLASEILMKAEEISKANNINSIKIDTHEDNLSMQRLLKKNGYEYCGLIYLKDNSKRVAFEKMF